MSNWEKYLKEIYLDPSHPASFGSPERLYKIVKKRKGNINYPIHKLKKVDTKTTIIFFK